MKTLMRTTVIAVLLAHAPAATPTPAPPSSSAPTRARTTLRDAGRRVGLLMGSQFKWDLAVSEATRREAYCAFHAHEYALSSAGNVCKMDQTQPFEGVYTLDSCNASIAHAHAAGQLYRGHVLCWHTQAPAWLDAYVGNKSALTVILEARRRLAPFPLLPLAVLVGSAVGGLRETQCIDQPP